MWEDDWEDPLVISGAPISCEEKSGSFGLNK
jgi:hypothetical protein